MRWTRGDVWRAECLLPPGADFEFKLAVRRQDGTWYWAPGTNAAIQVPNYRRTYNILVTVVWGGAARIVKPFTRSKQVREDLARARREAEELEELLGNLSEMQGRLKLEDGDLRMFSEVLRAVQSEDEAEVLATSNAASSAMQTLKGMLEGIDSSPDSFLDPLSPAALAADMEVAGAARTMVEAFRAVDSDTQRLLGDGQGPASAEHLGEGKQL
mmetsp:Transcript_16003/g.45289  ORF Transcript_16003/g.45289 Transcript_16003/m.45289 type:complete len:214 (+) Transcript_16003:137-778(+)